MKVQNQFPAARYDLTRRWLNVVDESLRTGRRPERNSREEFELFKGGYQILLNIEEIRTHDRLPLRHTVHFHGLGKRVRDRLGQFFRNRIAPSMNLRVNLWIKNSLEKLDQRDFEQGKQIIDELNLINRYRPNETIQPSIVYIERALNEYLAPPEEERSSKRPRLEQA